MKNLRVGITHGDYNGVGYEVILKALADEKITELFTPVVFCVPRLMEKARKDMNIDMPPMQVIKRLEQVVPDKINLYDIGMAETPLTPGMPTAESGKAAVMALEAAVEALQAGDIDVLVTAPISKAAVQSEEFHFPGHTEFLAARLGDEDTRAQMILFDDNIRMALVTTHLAISEISPEITEENVLESLRTLNAVLRQDFGCERPKIAVFSLNPHCGDNGLLGAEEQTAISPAIEKAMEEGILAFGPYSADGFFAGEHYRHFDGVLAMYHDQGLAPFKALAGEKGVNFTAGLDYVRTSPDHGTAYDIAWKGEADASSMREAIYRAIDIFRTRQRYLRASANPLRKAKLEKTADKTIDLEKDTL